MFPRVKSVFLAGTGIAHPDSSGMPNRLWVLSYSLRMDLDVDRVMLIRRWCLSMDEPDMVMMLSSTSRASMQNSVCRSRSRGEMRSEPCPAISGFLMTISGMTMHRMRIVLTVTLEMLFV